MIARDLDRNNWLARRATFKHGRLIGGSLVTGPRRRHPATPKTWTSGLRDQRGSAAKGQQTQHGRSYPLTDAELEAILAAGKKAGASSASWIMLRLPREVSPLVQEWLNANFPDRSERIMARLREMHGGREYDPRWGRRMRGEGPYAEMIAQRFSVALKRLNLRETAPKMRCDLFVPPRLPSAQLDLF